MNIYDEIFLFEDNCTDWIWTCTREIISSLDQNVMAICAFVGVSAYDFFACCGWTCSVTGTGRVVQADASRRRGAAPAEALSLALASVGHRAHRAAGPRRWVGRRSRRLWCPPPRHISRCIRTGWLVQSRSPTQVHTSCSAPVSSSSVSLMFTAHLQI